ncbi:MAG: imidazoleglycerol-phosphate dehydratase HisB [Nitrososphaeria archaeon]|nr:imidazoleglycerol-phosphate dehydratase HisB [Nitrososphaeria archaeon]NIN53658.1 imidazoleglycerol-phosphate dehydratase HisB [Nitrososphaeria archaeon]NIQ34191.1 imidazoleglycerol-phosphate dehydratase HisB [Nitrososphaeria archaeon]
MNRKGKLKRKTKETNVSIKINLDGQGEAKTSTGVKFLDHLLNTLVLHSCFDLELEANGDLQHHLIEDVAICLGQALKEAMGKRENIKRFGYSIVPMDEALVLSSVDLVRRAYSKIDLAFERDKIEDTYVEDLIHFLNSLTSSAEITLHVKVIHGENDHHKAEACFKSLALSLREALSTNSRGQAPSLKGVM